MCSVGVDGKHDPVHGVCHSLQKELFSCGKEYVPSMVHLGVAVTVQDMYRSSCVETVLVMALNMSSDVQGCKRCCKWTRRGCG